MTLVAGIDSSTQSCKVVIRDLDSGELVRSGRAPHPDGTEVDPAAWWGAVSEALADAGGLSDVAAISVAAQQHGLVALDGDGNVIRPALLWNDVRSAAAADQLVAELGADAFAKRVGVVPVAAITLAKLRWLRDHEPDNAARVAAIALPHDWLSWRLRGYGPAGEAPNGPVLEELATDRSDASGTGYFSAVSNAYDLDLLEQGFGRRDVVLPRVLAPADAAGDSATVAGAAGALVAAGAGDNAGAALGLDARLGDVVVSVGTSGTVFAVSDVPVSDPSGAIAGFADASGQLLPLVCTLNASRVLDSTAALLSTDHAGLDELAVSAAPAAGGVVMLPYYEGERTPNLPDARGSLHGLTLASATRENVARACVEGILCGLADGLSAIRCSGIQARRLMLTGGGARSAAVQRIAAQVFDLPVTVPAPGEYVADGAAVQAAWALTGARPSWPVAVSTEIKSDHRPAIREQYRRHAALELRSKDRGTDGNP